MSLKISEAYKSMVVCDSLPISTRTYRGLSLEVNRWQSSVLCPYYTFNV